MFSICLTSVEIAHGLFRGKPSTRRLTVLLALDEEDFPQKTGLVGEINDSPQRHYKLASTGGSGFSMTWILFSCQHPRKRDCDPLLPKQVLMLLQGLLHLPHLLELFSRAKSRNVHSGLIPPELTASVLDQVAVYQLTAKQTRPNNSYSRFPKWAHQEVSTG
ncbi:hypothetical protein AVEN_77542-1 [Araneus ventricosus]|uniref:Uncharacterized protein n=1 Tax=Araneus ventricosus TaxID=182803 RepID=A0A4Y2UHZ7_ARAVE|nr:hypothetical protein AVEN_77542-1 [Araneus ventricosus]